MRGQLKPHLRGKNKKLMLKADVCIHQHAAIAGCPNHWHELADTTTALNWGVGGRALPHNLISSRQPIITTCRAEAGS